MLKVQFFLCNNCCKLPEYLVKNWAAVFCCLFCMHAFQMQAFLSCLLSWCSQLVDINDNNSLNIEQNDSVVWLIACYWLTGDNVSKSQLVTLQQITVIDCILLAACLIKHTANIIWWCSIFENTERKHFFNCNKNIFCLFNSTFCIKGIIYKVVYAVVPCQKMIVRDIWKFHCIWSISSLKLLVEMW